MGLGKIGKKIGKVAKKVVKKGLPVAARVVGTIYGGPAGGAIAGGVADAVCGNKKSEGAKSSNPLGAIGGMLKGNSGEGGSLLSSVGSIFGNGNKADILNAVSKGFSYMA